MAPAIDLRPDHRKIVEDILRDHLPDGAKVWVFGSRAEWTTKDSSDLDLALEGDGPLDRRIVMALELAFEESFLPFRVDVVDLERVQERFREIVLRSRVGLSLPRDGEATYTNRGEMGFSDAFLVNPRVKLERDVEYPFVEMSDLMPGLRAAVSTRRRRFRGGASRFRAGDTLMARITPCLENGKIARYVATRKDDVGHGSTEFIVIRGRPDVTDTEFAFYVTRSDSVREYAISQMSGTSGRQRVPVDALNTLMVSVPSLPEQRAIASVLGTLDDRIELNRRMNEILDAMARALFKSWFVDFDPVRSKMEGRDAGLPSEIADLFPDRLVESELGEIPEGWAVMPLAEVMEINPVRTLSRGHIAPYLDMANMPRTGHVPLSIRMRNFGSGTRFVNGDTLMARITPCLEHGKTAYVDFLQHGEVGWGSTEFIVLRPRLPIPGEYAYCLARSSRLREHAIASMTGSSGRQRVPPAALSQFLVCVATPGIYRAFGDSVSALFARVREGQRRSRAATSLRDMLLPKLVSGEVRVPSTLVGRYNDPAAPAT